MIAPRWRLASIHHHRPICPGIAIPFVIAAGHDVTSSWPRGPAKGNRRRHGERARRGGRERGGWQRGFPEAEASLPANRLRQRKDYRREFARGSAPQKTVRHCGRGDFMGHELARCASVIGHFGDSVIGLLALFDGVSSGFLEVRTFRWSLVEF